MFAYADSFDLEGLVASPYGLGGKDNILEVIDAYEHDYPAAVVDARAPSARSHHPLDTSSGTDGDRLIAVLTRHRKYRG